MRKYYEIICDIGIIGVCCTTDDKDILLHCTKEDNVRAFGEIAETDFYNYGDHPWTQPISVNRWVPIIKEVLTLHPLDTK